MAYNPNEPRDKSGQWTSGGGGGSAPKRAGTGRTHSGKIKGGAVSALHIGGRPRHTPNSFDHHFNQAVVDMQRHGTAKTGAKGSPFRHPHDTAVARIDAVEKAHGQEASRRYAAGTLHQLGNAHPVSRSQKIAVARHSRKRR